MLHTASPAPTVTDALTLATSGLPIIPLRPQAKTPQFREWQHRATTDAATIQRWWIIWPDSNLGYVVPQGMLVIDIDPRHGGLVAWQQLLTQHDDLPATWRVRSGGGEGGCHLYFATPAGFHVPYVTTLAPGVEVLGLRHLVVLPPSLHPDTGAAYTWEAQMDPSTISPPALAPEWLLTRIHQTAKRHPRPARLTSSPPVSPSQQSEQGTQGALGTLFRGTGARLAALACDPQYLSAFLTTCGLSAHLHIGDNLCCPSHDDTIPSAVLLGPSADHRSFGLYCHACQRYRSLVDLYKDRVSAGILSIHTERPEDTAGPIRHHGALRLQWLTRFLEDAGILTFRELGCPTVPHEAPEDVKMVWGAFLHVRRLRAVTRDAGAPLPFSLRFIEDWIGQARTWTRHRINVAKRWLIAKGYLEVAETDGTCLLWRIGRCALRRVRIEAVPLATEEATVADVDTTVVPAPLPSASPCPERLVHTAVDGSLDAQEALHHEPQDGLVPGG